MDLDDRVEAVLTEENIVIKQVEEFKRKKKDILEKVDERLENRKSETLLKAKEDLIKIELTVTKCRYWNRGFCKEGSDCKWLNHLIT